MISLDYIIIYKLLVLDKNTWNYTTLCKSILYIILDFGSN